jgi:hypothetical protein
MDQLDKYRNWALLNKARCKHCSKDFEKGDLGTSETWTAPKSLRQRTTQGLYLVCSNTECGHIMDYQEAIDMASHLPTIREVSIGARLGLAPKLYPKGAGHWYFEPQEPS